MKKYRDAYLRTLIKPGDSVKRADGEWASYVEECENSNYPRHTLMFMVEGEFERSYTPAGLWYENGESTTHLDFVYPFEIKSQGGKEELKVSSLWVL